MRRLLPYFSFRGRTNRAPFLVTTLAVFLIAYVAYNVLATFGRLGPALTITVQVVFVPVLVIYVAVAVRRLHDRNRSGWWLLLLGLGPGFLGGLVRGGLVSGALKETSANALMAISLLILAWAIVELGVLKGTAGPNRFGEDPLAPAA